ncbi:MAG: nitroreductase family deazaflavin-dependent oxidoreductase [Acidimicrobiia bacterium]|nr:nitroreductase family deazaflavin-dependent oxidoreductase [Acidimicrobiia bacterium]
MGLANDLGYRYEQPNALHALVQKVASSKGGAWLFSKLLHHADRVVSGATGAATTASTIFAGMPVIDLTTIGARSGDPRTTPLLGIPTGDHLAIIGSGWGQAPTPGWVYNLRANPEATVAHKGKSVTVLARAAEGDELDRIWATARQLYDGYAKYPVRASHREIAVFVLEPAGA